MPAGGVAQLGERLNGIQEVVGSIPIGSTSRTTTQDNDGFISFETKSTGALPARAFRLFDIVKAGLAGLCTPVDLNNLDPMIASQLRENRIGLVFPSREAAPGFFSGHGTPMLSDQALKQGRLEDALACTGDEGRSKLR